MKSDRLTLNDYFQTSDLSLATIISLYYSIDTIDKSNPYKVVFLFKRNEGLDKLIEAYWRKDLAIEPQAIFQQLRTLKARLHNEM